MLRNTVAVLVGVVLGGIVNMGLVTAGPTLIAPPAGLDMTSVESLREGAHMLEPKHFLFPFLGHALGTLAGALAAFLIAASYKTAIALGIGVFFLIGGVAASTMIPSPAWFVALDLLGAYVPMGWLAVNIGRRMLSAQFPIERSS